ncbi:MAG: ZIP family zinc transporter [Actinobacteria bacterium]|jgi:ZIP family zinc transporter|nr:MAG: ZIP family zinc transporter [Actinomycetota bacterium]
MILHAGVQGEYSDFEAGGESALNSLAAAMWGGLGASALLVGAVIAMFRKPSERMTGMVMAFGSGTLISAIAYELIPESTLGKGAGMGIAFIIGALTFFLGDLFIDRLGGASRKSIGDCETDGSGTAIFLGTLLDGVPESLILGIGLGLGGSVSIAFLVAVFVSNIPEGVAGTVSLQREGHSRRTILFMWSCLLLASAVAAGLGYLFTQMLDAIDGQYMQAFAAGAMLTMLADTMMPEAFKYGGKIVGIITVFGFLAAAVLSVVE